MKRRQEEFSRSSFSSWIESQGLADQSVWFEVDQKDEPPDWYLEIGTTRYAIEATSVVDYIGQFDPPLSSSSVSAYLFHLIDRIEKEAKSRGPLNGAYVITLAPIPNLNKHEKWLFDELLSYIDRTRKQLSTEEYNLGKIGYNTLSISKLESDREYVAPLVSFGAKSEGEASEELQKELSRILEEKFSSLENIDDKVILLLLDAFQYSHIVEWKNIFSELTVPIKFESIFRTQTEGQAQLLYSRREWWKECK